MKETTAKRREKPGKDSSKADKSKDAAGPEPLDVDMPEEDATTAAKAPKELDSLTLEGNICVGCCFFRVILAVRLLNVKDKCVGDLSNRYTLQTNTVSYISLARLTTAAKHVYLVYIYAFCVDYNETLNRGAK